MAGFSTTNTMHAERRMSRLYVCGDNESDSSDGAGLTSTRVMACAGMAAHLVMRIILGLEH
jgi:sulfur carrier protein ThiS adenylyltransferase